MSISNGNGREVTTPLKEARLSLGLKIIGLRRRNNFMEQQELADRCNSLKLTSLTQPRISNIERGETDITFLEAQAIATVFNENLDGFRV